MGFEQLQQMRVDELRKLASANGIKNASKYRKADLVRIIFDAGVTTSDATSDDHNAQSVSETKHRYITNAMLGTIVAFRLPNGKVKSAKIMEKFPGSNESDGVDKLRVVTSYGKQFLIPYSSVIWVKSTDRWPKGVYNQLKGIVDTATKESEQ